MENEHKEDVGRRLACGATIWVLGGLNKEDHGGLIAWARSLAELGYFGVLDSEIACLETPCSS